MSHDELGAGQVATITAYVDVHAPPPALPSAMFLFGTNRAAPAILAAERHHQGLAPLIITTGGVNRHTGVVEGREFQRLPRERHVPDEVIRSEHASINTWQNVEYAMPYLREARDAGLPITVVCKWYHRRAIHILSTLLPDLDGFYAITWEPTYGHTPVTRVNWPDHPQGRRRVLREWQEVRRRVTEGSLRDATVCGGMWRPSDPAGHADPRRLPTK